MICSCIDLKKVLLALSALILFFLSAYTRENVRYLWEPKLSVSKKMASDLSAQSSVLIRQDVDFGNNSLTIAEKLDAQFSLTRSFFNGSKAGIGYVFGGDDLFRPQVRDEHRLMEQYAFYVQLSKIRFGNRIRSEQRFYPTKYKNRFRYRLTTDFPLSGERLNQKEAYFIAGNEVLVNFNAWENNVENRLSAGIGWKLSDIYNFQVQLQWRSYNIESGSESHAMFLATAFYVKL